MNRSLHAAIDSPPARPAAPPVAPMQSSMRAGGLAALLQAATFVFGFVIYGTVIAGGEYGDLAITATEHVTFLADNQLILHVWYAVIYLVFGGALVVLAPALYDRVHAATPVLARTATLFGLIWAVLMFAVGMSAIVGGDLVLAVHDADPSQAASLWSSLTLLIEGMGGGIELVGGLWIGLISVAGLRARVLPVWLNRIGVITGIAGVASTAMLAGEAVTSVFGLGSIIWFTWLGVHLVRTARTSRVQPVAAR